MHNQIEPFLALRFRPMLSLSLFAYLRLNLLVVVVVVAPEGCELGAGVTPMSCALLSQSVGR